MEWVLYVVWRGWVQQIWFGFTVCRSKSIVLVGLAAIVPAQGRASRMTLPHMEEVLIRAGWGVTTILTHKDFGTSLTVGVLLMNAVDLPHVRLQRASLCEGFLTQLTLVWADACGNRDNDFQTLELINSTQSNQTINNKTKLKQNVHTFPKPVLLTLTYNWILNLQKMEKNSKGPEFECWLTCVCSHVPLQVKGIVKSFTTELTWMSLHQAVTLEVAGQHALQGEELVADWAYEVTSARGSARSRLEELVKTFSVGLEKFSKAFFTFTKRVNINCAFNLFNNPPSKSFSLIFAFIVSVYSRWLILQHIVQKQTLPLLCWVLACWNGRNSLWASLWTSRTCSKSHFSQLLLTVPALLVMLLHMLMLLLVEFQGQAAGRHAPQHFHSLKVKIIKWRIIECTSEQTT